MMFFHNHELNSKLKVKVIKYIFFDIYKILAIEIERN
jgi:hypothetical protein